MSDHSPGHALSRRTFMRYSAAGASLAGLGPLLAACGSGSSGGGGGGGGNSGTVTVWHYFSVKSQVRVLKDYESLFTKKYPKATVNYVYVPYDKLVSKLIAAAGVKQGPDVLVTNGESLAQLVAAGAVKDMTSYWDSFSDKGQFPETVVKRMNGKIYGAKGYVNLLALWYNKDILEKSGVRPPTTFDEMTAALGNVSGGKTIGLTLTGKPNAEGEWQSRPWYSGYGFDYKHPQVGALEETFALIGGWADHGYIPRDASTWDQVVPFQRFLVGNVAFAENGNWHYGDVKKAKFDYGVVPLPGGPDGSEIYLGGEDQSIGAFAKNPDLAWKYLESTYFSRQGGSIAMRDVGSIPARRDGASDPKLKNDPVLSEFVRAAKRGVRFPPGGFGTKISRAELAVAQEWSAVIAGQKDPSKAAQEAIRGVEKALR